MEGAQAPAKGAERAVPEEPKVVVAAGGTAGHVVPAMAVAEELRASGAAVSWLGTRERIEAELVPAAGFEIDFLRVRGIDRRNPLRAARAGIEAVGAVGGARGGPGGLGWGGGWVVGGWEGSRRDRCSVVCFRFNNNLFCYRFVQI